MKKKYRYHILALSLFLLGVVTYLAWQWSQSNLLYAPLGDHLAVAICKSFPSDYGYTVDEYRDQKKEIGGFVAYSTLAVGSSAHYYDGNGNQVAELYSLPWLTGTEEDTAVTKWKEKILRYPVKRTYACNSFQSTP